MTIRSRWPRRLAWIVGVIVLVPVIGWSLFWLYARWQVSAQMDVLTTDAPGASVVLTCAQRRVGGFPLDIAIRCDDAVITAPGDAGPVTLRVPRLTITTRLYDPNDQTIEVGSPLLANGAAGTARAEWNLLQIGVRGAAPAYDSAFLHADGLTVACASCPEALQQATASTLELLMQRRGDTDDFTFSLSSVDLQNALLARLLASTRPVSLSAAGTITDFQIPTALRFAAETERWRAAGGKLLLDSAAVDQDDRHVQVAGQFALDPLHRPAGTFTVEARNASSMLAALTGGLSPLLQLAIGAALRGIDTSTAKSGSDLSVKLPGAINGGAVTIGPLQGIATVAPLY